MSKCTKYTIDVQSQRARDGWGWGGCRVVRKTISSHAEELRMRWEWPLRTTQMFHPQQSSVRTILHININSLVVSRVFSCGYSQRELQTRHGGATFAAPL